MLLPKRSNRLNIGQNAPTPDIAFEPTHSFGASCRRRNAVLAMR